MILKDLLNTDDLYCILNDLISETEDPTCFTYRANQRLKGFSAEIRISKSLVDGEYKLIADISPSNIEGLNTWEDVKVPKGSPRLTWVSKISQLLNQKVYNQNPDFKIVLKKEIEDYLEKVFYLETYSSSNLFTYKEHLLKKLGIERINLSIKRDKHSILLRIWEEGKHNEKTYVHIEFDDLLELEEIRDELYTKILKEVLSQEAFLDTLLNEDIEQFFGVIKRFLPRHYTYYLDLSKYNFKYVNEIGFSWSKSVLDSDWEITSTIRSDLMEECERSIVTESYSNIERLSQEVIQKIKNKIKQLKRKD